MADPTPAKTVEKIKDMLRAGERVPDIAAATGIGESTIYTYKRKMRDAGELDGDTVAPEKRVARRRSAAVDQPVDDADNNDEGGAADEAAEVEYLRARNAELTEHCVDMSIELVRLQRLLRSQQEA